MQLVDIRFQHAFILWLSKGHIKLGDRLYILGWFYRICRLGVNTAFNILTI